MKKSSSDGQFVYQVSGSPGPEPAFCSIEKWCALSGMGRRSTYDAIGRNVLRAVKCGARTLVDVPHGLAYLRSLPAARIRPQQKREGGIRIN